MTLPVLGRRCVVVGAAPLTAPLVIADDETVIAVNGGISSTTGVVDAWVLNSRDKQLESWGPSFKALNRLMLRQGAQRVVKTAVLLTKGGEHDADVTMRALVAQGTWVSTSIEIVQTERTRIEREVGARIPAMKKHALSAGLFAVCLCLYSGASHVRMAGFSWHGGYAYTTAPAARGHAHGDRIALARLCAQYGARLTCFDERIAAMAKKQPPTPPTETAVQTPAPVPMRVRATTMLIYHDQRRREGSVFTLKSSADFRPRQMEQVAPDTPETTRAGIQARRVDHLETLRGKRLQPNAADLIEDEADAATPTGDQSVI